MAEYLDFFNGYVMGSVQMLTGFHFFTGFLKKKAKLFDYLLFAVLGIAIMAVVPAGSMTELLAYALLLVAGGILCAAPCRGNMSLRRRMGRAASRGRKKLPYSIAQWTQKGKMQQADKESIVLYAALTVEIMQLCYGIFNSALSILYPLMFSLEQKTVGFTFMVLGNAASLSMAVFCYCMVNRYFSHTDMVKRQYVLMILTPILMLFLMGEYISHGIYGNVTDSNEVIFNTNHYQMLLIQLLGMASLFCILSAYKKLLENFRLSTELSLLEQEEHSLNQYVEEAKARYEKTKSFRHDIKNHITVVKELLQRGKSEQALNYIGDMEGMTEELSFPCSTNNPAVDILLGNKLGIAKSMGVDVHCSLTLPYPCAIRDIDFGIILSNALDNAIHACQSMDNDAEKYIRVTGRIQGDFILIEVENSFQGKRAFRKGTGLSNVKAVAEKYHGAMRVEMQDKRFILSVLLIIS